MIVKNVLLTQKCKKHYVQMLVYVQKDSYVIMIKQALIAIWLVLNPRHRLECFDEDSSNHVSIDCEGVKKLFMIRIKRRK